MHADEPIWQLARFVIAGAALTLLVSLIYLLAITVIHLSPALSLTVATLIASVAGYFAHGAFSFRGFGMRDRAPVRFARFLTTNGIGYLLNLAFVFVLVGWARLPEWAPIIAFCTITPLVSFTLNRTWVFG
jgi:putative flippase GtrA